MQINDERVQAELDRISVYYEDMEESRRALIDPLLENAAFMKVALEDLQEEIARSGPVERYQNGANQFGLKPSAATSAYNSLVKNYAAVIKVLSDKLPYKRTKIPTPSPWRKPERSEEELRKMREESYRSAHALLVKMGMAEDEDPSED